MVSHITSDQSLKIGDLVFSTYHKGEYLFIIKDIRRRFYTIHDITFYNSYKNRKVGDEYNPIMSIESIANLSITASLIKKYRKISKQLDASYLIKVKPEYILEHIDKLKNLLNDL